MSAVDKPPYTSGPPVIGYEDHDTNFTMFDVQVRRANLDNHWEAQIIVPGVNGKTFTARHAEKSQAIADVELSVRDAHRRGDIYPGVF